VERKIAQSEISDTPFTPRFTRSPLEYGEKQRIRNFGTQFV
jgi:hypothetical protein